MMQTGTTTTPTTGRNYTQAVVTGAGLIGALAAVGQFALNWRSQPKIAKVDALEARVDTVEKRIDGLQHAIAGVDANVKASEERLMKAITGNRETARS